MNHPGEIAYLADITRPSVALVNNAQREHLEFMHTVDAVARENGSVISALAQDGVAVFPAGDEYTPLWRELAGACRCLTFAGPSPQPSPQRGEGVSALPVLPPLPLGEGGGEGLRAESADVYCENAQWQGDAWTVRIATPLGAFDTRLHIAGLHNVTNALAATACAVAAGVPLAAIAAGLAAFEPVKGRSRALALHCQGRAITVVDDSYNANPDSVRAAIAVLADLPGPHLLVLGDMGEVGNQGPQFHAEAGAHAHQSGIEQLFALGALSVHAAQACGPAARHFEDMASLLAAVQEALPGVGSVLVKGSRFMKMEQVVQAMEGACS